MPPAIIASASPCWMSRKESPTAWAPLAQAVAVAEFGPLAPVRIETQPAARLTITAGMKNGLIFRGPALEQRLVLALDGGEAADAAADEDAHPSRARRRRRRRPASSSARSAAAIANWMKRSIFLTSFFSIQAQGVEALHLAGEAGGVLRRVEQRDGRRPGAAGEEGLPGLLGADPQRGHEPHPGDDDPALRGHVASSGRAYFLPACFSM